MLEYETTFEPFAQHPFIHRDILDEPLMADMVETPLDVSFEHPLRGFFFRQVSETLFDGILSASFLPKTIRDYVSGGFC